MKKKLYQSEDNIYRKKFGSTSPPLYPNEMLVKICSSKHYSKLTSGLFNRKIKVCEIGCFAGNNLRFFADKGYDVSGIEINQYLIKICKSYLKKFGLKKKIKLFIGNNNLIPLKKKSLDLLVSINTIHYSYGKQLLSSLTTFKSVLKKNGIAIIETPAPEHIIFKNSKKIKKLHYKFKLPTSDHRTGLDIGLFDDQKHLKSVLLRTFDKVEIARRTENYYNKKYDFFVAICKS